MTSHEVTESKAFGFVFEQYVENASFLWVLHDTALELPNYLLDDLEELKTRIDSNLKGLLTDTKFAWTLCEAVLQLDEPGETFTAAMIAFHTDDHTHIETVVNHALSHPNCLKALISALCWLPNDISQAWINTLLLSKNIEHKYIAISACSKLRQDPGTYLDKLLQRKDCNEHQALMCRCLKLIGELKRQDLNQHLSHWLESDTPELSFWSAWSLTLLGHKHGLPSIERHIIDSSPHLQQAIEIAFRGLSLEHSRHHIESLVNQNLIREAITASAILGDPEVIAWLLDLMGDPEWARAAGEAFTFITGTDLEEQKMDTEAPKHWQLGPNDNTDDDDVAMDLDENLPWPNRDKISKHWSDIEPSFEKGRRYFLGEFRATHTLLHHIEHGAQRQRIAAALHLAMASPEQAFINAKI